MVRIHWFSMTLRIIDLLVRQHWNSKHVKKRKWIDTVDSSIHPRSYNNLNLIISCRSFKIYYRPIKKTNLKIFISADMILRENYPVHFVVRKCVPLPYKITAITSSSYFQLCFQWNMYWFIIWTENGFPWKREMSQYSILY